MAIRDWEMGTFLISITVASIHGAAAGNEECPHFPHFRAQFTRVGVRIAHITANRFRTASTVVRRAVLQNSVKSAMVSTTSPET
jgi:hypothetical protein